MEELYSHLEAQLKTLIQQCEKLKNTNEALRYDTSLLLLEKESIMQKHQRAVAQIKTMVSYLTSVERPL